METKDFFYEIAKTKHPGDTTDKEVEARTVPEHMFRQGRVTDLPEIQRKTYEEEKREFRRQLEEIKEYYRPFMSNYLIPVETKKESFSLEQFLFRYKEKEERFTDRNAARFRWETITVPDYRGPAEEEGKWQAYYKTEFSCPKGWKKDGYRIVLSFQCVDYIAEIYVNGNFIGRHEGFFAPFSFDVTEYVDENNELLVLCKNDIPILGVGEFLDGDKIYAATGPGWDDPETGWHHCPAGAGIFGSVCVELRPELYVDDIFVRPDLEQNCVEVRTGIINYTDQVCHDLVLRTVLEPKNYEGNPIGVFEKKIKAVGPGKNEYRYFFQIENYRLWNPDTPWLYGASAVLFKGEDVISAAVQTTGLKVFTSDECSKPKGKFSLNGKPIVLRGVNEMGHLQQCVMNRDFEQLTEDILIAKLCHVNYYRITQRPVQEEIYDYCDMLGMMHQCDFPLFSFLRRPQLTEALRQVEEMEHLVRKHVSTVMVTLINEPMCIRKTENPDDKFSRRYEAKGHRHLLRDELEAFFAAARKVIYVQNPDRVVKNVEGDYDGPTEEGMPDFHTYTMWYTNHGQPIGKLMRGYLPPVKDGWMIGCGEYGAEGLDPVDLMQRRYPKEWLEKEEDGNWYPDRIVRAQTYSIQGDWYKEQTDLAGWVEESQKHQAIATKLMTDAFRRRGDVINQTAIHLLIDAWPAGWMKTLVDCERTPKPAYFAYRDALVPLKVNLYSGRRSCYEDETVPVEAWILNDTGDRRNLLIQAEIWEEDDEAGSASYFTDCQIGAADAVCAGMIPVTLQAKGKERTVCIKAALLDENRIIVHQEELQIRVYPRRMLDRQVYAAGEEAENLLRQYMSECHGDEQTSMWLVSGKDAVLIEKMKEHVKKGGQALWLLPQESDSYLFGDYEIKVKACGNLFFAAADSPYEGYDMRMLYNDKKGYIDATGSYVIETDMPGESPVYTYAKGGKRGAKQHEPFVKICRVGKGNMILFSLEREGRAGFNGGLDNLILDLLEGEV